MDLLEELKIHVDALVNVVEQDSKFFVSIISYVRRLKDIIEDPNKKCSQTELELLTSNIERFYGQYRPSLGDGLYIPPRQTSDSDSTVEEIAELVREMTALDENSFETLLESRAISHSSIDKRTRKTVSNECIFIGHGRSKLWARIKIFLKDELGLETVTYESESRIGESIVPILDQLLKQATFAILVLTAEDETADGSIRARQNVVHEAGLFQGRLGFKKAIILRQDSLEDFTNVAGLQHIGFTGDQIEKSFYELQRVLKREGILLLRELSQLHNWCGK